MDLVINLLFLAYVLLLLFNVILFVLFARGKISEEKFTDIGFDVSVWGLIFIDLAFFIYVYFFG